MNCIICKTKEIKILKDFNLLPRSFDYQKKANCCYMSFEQSADEKNQNHFQNKHFP